MSGLSDITDAKGKVNYNGLVSYLKGCTMNRFVEEAKHPLLVGKELYDGELMQNASGVTGGETNTLIFNAAQFRKPKNEIDVEEVDIEKTQTHTNPSISRAVYIIRKSRDSYESTPNIITIGRARENDMVIPDYVVSKHHAHIHIFYGKYFLVDAGSTNGTSVNKQRLKPNIKVQVPLNSEVAFGRICFVLISPGDLYRYLT